MSPSPSEKLIVRNWVSPQIITHGPSRSWVERQPPECSFILPFWYGLVRDLLTWIHARLLVYPKLNDLVSTRFYDAPSQGIGGGGAAGRGDVRWLHHADPYFLDGSGHRGFR
ncbi:hypothetical protein [Pelagicoccus sp. SDUM812002]|uniref:hypothetical protein n=1 Tax=Pelagicoccus sp. SDUM812002 TaxID=3041266 RepID=UPI00280C7DF4|nr:hypothetical protein [Pelagicoccus sp. SDUM812002]MDQ8187772.1 hypothetical protein [Pelagicoccus sp. SDUM812002]